MMKVSYKNGVAAVSPSGKTTVFTAVVRIRGPESGCVRRNP